MPFTAWFSNLMNLGLCTMISVGVTYQGVQLLMFRFPLCDMNFDTWRWITPLRSSPPPPSQPLRKVTFRVTRFTTEWHVCCSKQCQAEAASTEPVLWHVTYQLCTAMWYSSMRKVIVFPPICFPYGPFASRLFSIKTVSSHDKSEQINKAHMSFHMWSMTSHSSPHKSCAVSAVIE